MTKYDHLTLQEQKSLVKKRCKELGILDTRLGEHPTLQDYLVVLDEVEKHDVPEGLLEATKKYGMLSQNDDGSWSNEKGDVIFYGATI